ncbi:flavodoxin [Gramella sp. KN1008]|uniref:flavodoxin family protein n=1 Tax=Gramella sp. KN1008 TaxID=2529298 RepID=UPI001F60312D|nr:flavodoxin [Gramella sp. KN1008]
MIFSVCTNPETENSGRVAKTLKQDNILIVYWTRTNNTKAVAEIIQRKVSGKLVALEKKNPYPENYQKIVAQVDRENEEGYLPPLKTNIKELGKYDIVFIGFPTWDMQMPPPMKSFLTENNLSGKTVIPFNTNAGFGVGEGFEQLKDLCPESKVQKGFSVEGGYEKKGVFLAIKGEREEKVTQLVDKWLREIGVL